MKFEHTHDGHTLEISYTVRHGRINSIEAGPTTAVYALEGDEPELFDDMLMGLCQENYEQLEDEKAGL